MEKSPETNTPENVSAVATTRWVRDEVVGTKKCEACGAVMRGWASREVFEYCPKCGKKAEKAM